MSDAVARGSAESVGFQPDDRVLMTVPLTHSYGLEHGVLAPEQQGLIEQGMEARRPSWIYIRAAKAGDAVTNVRVGGHVVQIINGTVTM